MTTYSTAFRQPGGMSGALKTFGAELSAFLDAILYPGKLIAEVKEMRRLLLEAEQLQSTDPARAARLRQRAAQLCR